MNTEDPRHRRAVAHFNRGDYFEAHEDWEEIWHEARGEDREFVQGLIQVATALHHMTLGNMRGARILHASAHALLSPLGDSRGGILIKNLLDQFDRSLKGILDVPLDQLAGRGHAGSVKIAFSPERAFQIEIQN